MPEVSEDALRSVDHGYALFPARYVDAGEGRRRLLLEEASILREGHESRVKPQRDFCPIVAARTLAGILDYIRCRAQGEYVITGQIGGELAGSVKDREMNKDTGVFYHTLAKGSRPVREDLPAKEQEEILAPSDSPRACEFGL